MVYEDRLTKFVVLRPLKSKTAEESDNGREFINKIMSNLPELWTNFKIVLGKPRHSQSQGSIDIENMLTTWAQEHNTMEWRCALRFVQLIKNSAIHFGIKKSLYQAMFGCLPKRGSSSTSLPPEAPMNLHSEDELENEINQVNVSSETGTETLQHNDQSKSLLQEDNVPTGTEVENREKENIPDSNDNCPTDLDETIRAIEKRRTEA
ncbi:KRAB-A domain-containing protein 2-like [Schistocerca americana]|uniref:KRAB-A domain-containing protein 2-like n=1 Tax=Schistocerca americana TaxID=7009 RepID=UPI001F4F348A|nr:KRAB-A domain-containing protein 2-like [Schistocerca americana]